MCGYVIAKTRPINLSVTGLTVHYNSIDQPVELATQLTGLK